MPCRIIVQTFQNLIFLLIIILFAVGLYGYLYRHEANFCEMTYMYENPTYHRISLPKSIESQYRRYALYSYCEGARCDAHQRNQFTGYPVLFIVGNADSYRQVRSLGSVAYRMGTTNKQQLEFFSIDFNEELSALFGGVLEEQTQFVAHAIQTILALYKTKKTIVLVGNSIGGLLSRAVFLQPSSRFDPNTVRLIITQATPHQAPVIHSDSYVVNFYSRVNQFWKDEWNQSLKHLVVLSLAGGDRDHLVRSDLCSLDGLTDKSRSIDVVTTAVPNVWTSTDHRCIVWCRQLVLATTRALLEVIQEQELNPQATMQVLKRYFSPSINFNAGFEATPIFNNQTTIITQSRVSLQRADRNGYLIPLKTSKYAQIILHLTNARIFLRNENISKDLTRSLLSIPPTYNNRKMIRFDLKNLDESLQQYDSIIIRLDDHRSQADIYQTKGDEEIVELPIIGSQTLSFKKKGYVKLVFPTLKHLWQVYNTHLSSSTNNIPFVHFHVPWSNEDLYNLITVRNPSPPPTTLSTPLYRDIRLKLHQSPRSKTDQYPSLELFLDTAVTYTLQIESSFIDMLSQLIRYYVFLLPTFSFTVLCISYSLQVKDIGLRTYQTMLAWQIHIPVAIIITILYKIVIVLCPSSSFAVNIHDNGYYFCALPLIMYFLALSLWAFISFVIDYLIFDFCRPILIPIFMFWNSDPNYRIRMARVIQWIALIIPLFSTIVFCGSNGHITLFLIASLHIIWRGTINIFLRQVLTTVLLFHVLLVALNLTGFIIHVRSAFVEGFRPLWMILPDVSFVSAICCLSGFYLRFMFNQNSNQSVQMLQVNFKKYTRSLLILLAFVSQFCCSYSMFSLWLLIFFIFIHVAVVFFIPMHRE